MSLRGAVSRFGTSEPRLKRNAVTEKPDWIQVLLGKMLAHKSQIVLINKINHRGWFNGHFFCLAELRCGVDQHTQHYEYAYNIQIQKRD